MLRAPLPIDEAERLAAMFKALGDPIRLRLLSVIASHESGEACVCELIASGFSVTGLTISHHLKVLREAGLIEGTRRGTWIYYRVLPDAVGALAARLPLPPTWRHIGVSDATQTPICLHVGWRRWCGRIPAGGLRPSRRLVRYFRPPGSAAVPGG
jgi:ArsR family transcriptional regulator, arsenate/arsenite/antimonite-responsive transcriptional repressor